MPDSGRGWAAPAIMVGGVIAASAYVGLVDPNQPGHYPLCPLKSLTGLDCPGCGGLRSVHDLLHGDVGSAINQNALLVVVFLPFVAIVLARWVRRRWRTSGPAAKQPARSSSAGQLVPAWATYTLLALTLVFAVARNIAAVPLLRSGLG